jgi:hypothetical protein
VVYFQIRRNQYSSWTAAQLLCFVERNHITREAHNRGTVVISFHILRCIRHLYIALHQGTDGAPTAFDAATDDRDFILFEPSSYPLCHIRGHLYESNNCPTAQQAITLIFPRSSHPHTCLDTVSRSPASIGCHSWIHLADSEELSLHDHDASGASQIVVSSSGSPPAHVETNRLAPTLLNPLITQGTTHTLPTILPNFNSSQVFILLQQCRHSLRNPTIPPIDVTA